MKLQPINWTKIVLWVSAGMLLLFVLAPLYAFAGDDDHHETPPSGSTTNVAQSAPTSVSTAIQGSRSIALGGSDMDIRDCLASYSVLFGLYQDTKVNPMCVADRMEARGDYQAAAKMRCSTWRYKRVYGKGQACIDAVKASPLEAPPAAPPAAVPVPMLSLTPAYSDNEDDDDWVEEHEELHIQQAQLLKTVDDLESELQKLKREPAKVQYITDPELEKRLEEDARRREAAAKILTEKN